MKTETYFVLSLCVLDIRTCLDPLRDSLKASSFAKMLPSDLLGVGTKSFDAGSIVSFFLMLWVASFTTFGFEESSILKIMSQNLMVSIRTRLTTSLKNHQILYYIL